MALPLQKGYRASTVEQVHQMQRNVCNFDHPLIRSILQKLEKNFPNHAN